MLVSRRRQFWYKYYNQSSHHSITFNLHASSSNLCFFASETSASQQTCSETSVLAGVLPMARAAQPALFLVFFVSVVQLQARAPWHGRSAAVEVVGLMACVVPPSSLQQGEHEDEDGDVNRTLFAKLLCLRGGGGDNARLAVRKVKGPAWTPRKNKPERKSRRNEGG